MRILIIHFILFSMLSNVNYGFVDENHEPVNPNAPRGNTGPLEAYFPGLEYVDILAADVYGNDYKQSHHEDMLKLAQGKPIALGECGQLPTPEILEKQPMWTWFMCWSGFLYKKNEPEAVKELYDAERVLTLGDVEGK